VVYYWRIGANVKPNTGGEGGKSFERKIVFQKETFEILQTIYDVFSELNDVLYL